MTATNPDYLPLATSVAATLNDAVREGRIAWHEAVRVACDYNRTMAHSTPDGAPRAQLHSDHRATLITPAAQLLHARLTARVQQTWQARG